MSSLRRFDVLSLAQLRNDGRKPNEIRRVKIQMGCVGGSIDSSSAASGSCIFEMGLTSVLACVFGPTECTRRSDELSDRAVLSVNVRIAPFAASSSDRRVVNPNTDRRLVEQSHLIRKAMEAAILLHLYPRAKIHIEVYILADDGGRLSAAINATTCALIDAGIGLKDMVCSCSAGLTPQGSDETPLVDLNRMEMQTFAGDAVVYLPCATMPQRGTIVLAQCESRLNINTYEQVLSAAVDGCDAIFEIMQASVREHSAQLLAARSGNVKVAIRDVHG